MSRLSEQEVIIEERARNAMLQRARAEAAIRSIDLPVEASMKSAGAALTVAEVLPGLAAIIGSLFAKSNPRKRRERLMRAALEAPRLFRAIRRMLAKSAH